MTLFFTKKEVIEDETSQHCLPTSRTFVKWQCWTRNETLQLGYVHQNCWANVWWKTKKKTKQTAKQDIPANINKHWAKEMLFNTVAALFWGFRVKGSCSIAYLVRASLSTLLGICSSQVFTCTSLRISPRSKNFERLVCSLSYSREPFGEYFLHFSSVINWLKCFMTT